MISSLVNSIKSLTFSAVQAILRGLLGLLFRMRVTGRDRVPSTGYILVANHLGWADPFLLLAYLPHHPRLFVLADKHGAFKHWWWRVVIEWSGRIIPIDRTTTFGAHAALRACYAILERGEALALFPEGVVGREESEIAPLKPGIGALCLRSGRPVLPVGIAGASELYLGRKLTLHIGHPFVPQRIGAHAQERIENATQQVGDALRSTLPPFVEEPIVHKRLRWLTQLFS